MKNRLPLLAASLLLTASLLSAQQPPEILSSVPLPGEMTDEFTPEPGMIQCDASGDMFVLRSSRHELLKVGLNGGVAVRIDVAGLAGLGNVKVHSFAPGPNGELYVLASHFVRYDDKGPDHNQPPVSTRWVDPHPTLLRFNANGELMFSKQIGQTYQVPWVAVFDSGEFLLLDGNWKKGAFARIYSAEGNLLRQAAVKENFLLSHANDGIMTYLLSAGDKAFVSVHWNRPQDQAGAAVAAIDSSGEVLGSGVVNLPKVKRSGPASPSYIALPRRRGEHILAQERRGSETLVEVDPMTGKVVSRYQGAPEGTYPGCETTDGMSFINVTDQKLEVMALPPKQ